MVVIFSFYQLFNVMEGIIANCLFQANAFSKGYNGKCAEGYFTTLIMIYIVYQDVFVGRAVVLD